MIFHQYFCNLGNWIVEHEYPGKAVGVIGLKKIKQFFIKEKIALKYEIRKK